MLIQPVVLSGGSGTRLWPLSREKYPKQLLALTGGDSLLQSTLRRLDGMSGAHCAPPLVVCNDEYRFVVAEQLRTIGKSGRIILEPVGRNTAPALTLAALATRAAQSDPTSPTGQDQDPVLLVMPADHVVTQPAVFQKAVCQAARLAQENVIVTFGITPDRPETGYGYIQAGATLNSDGANAITRFVEKPDHATAQAYVQSGDYLWNSGLFVLRASVWLKALQLCRPDILQACEAAWDSGVSDLWFFRAGSEAFAACPSDSIDYAVMERLTGAQGAPDPQGMPGGAVIALDAGWSDVGSWEALWQVLPKDPHGNVVQGRTLMHGSSNTLALSSGRLLACVGVQGLIVVETPDAVLVADQRHTQDVKKIVDQLKREGHSEGLVHRKVYRPWGWYDGVDTGARFQVKRIMVKPGCKLSLQMHHHRAEHWIVVRGTARVHRGDEDFLLTENQSTYIPLGVRHRLENPGQIDLEMIEVQSGSYLGEDDIVRFEDAYGR